MSFIKLNIFQRGILQKVATFIVYMACAIAGMLTLDRLEQQHFIDILTKARKQGIISNEIFQELNNLIVSLNETIIIYIILLVAVCGGVCWILMRWASSLNWSWPVVLPRAIEFRAAMRRLNIIEPNEEIEYIRKYKLPVFIASSPLLKNEQEKIRVKLYPFAHHVLYNPNVFERNIGRKTLCLDAADYDQFVNKIIENEEKLNSVLIASKNEELANLSATIKSLSIKNDELIKKYDELHGKVRIQNAQDESRVNRLRIERLLWVAYTSVIDRLIREAPDGKQYTTPEIEAAFNIEWEQREDLRAQMKKVTGNEKAEPSENFLKAVKEEFKTAGKLSSGGRPKKNH